MHLPSINAKVEIHPLSLLIGFAAAVLGMATLGNSAQDGTPDMSEAIIDRLRVRSLEIVTAPTDRKVAVLDHLGLSIRDGSVYLEAEFEQEVRTTVLGPVGLRLGRKLDDNSSVPCLTLTYSENGAGYISTQASDGSNLIVLSTSEVGSAAVGVYDRRGNGVVAIGEVNGFGNLHLGGAEGKPAVTLEADPLGNGAVHAWRSNGTRATLSPNL